MPHANAKRAFCAAQHFAIGASRPRWTVGAGSTHSHFVTLRHAHVTAHFTHHRTNSQYFHDHTQVQSQLKRLYCRLWLRNTKQLFQNNQFLPGYGHFLHCLVHFDIAFFQLLERCRNVRQMKRKRAKRRKNYILCLYLGHTSQRIRCRHLDSDRLCM